MNQTDYNKELFSFLAASPTQFHAAAWMKAQLLDNGFTLLRETDPWHLKPGGKYCVTRNGSAVIAFVIGRIDPTETGIRICGAHTDSPCLRVKPNPEIANAGMTRVGVEIYGGTLQNSWFDRGLNLAGRVTCLAGDRNGNKGLKSCLINFNRAVAVIPSLAIHLDREANTKKSINPQLHLSPLFTLSGKEPGFKSILLDQVTTEHPDTDIQEVLDFELYFTDAKPPEYAGIDRNFILAPRLDNLLSCHAGLKAILDADLKGTSLLICSDHEEVGSETFAGARGSFVESILTRILPDPESFARAAAASFMISCDNAHGVHPAFIEKHDANHLPKLGHGPVLKINAAQRYATDSESASFLRYLCRKSRIPLQEFVMRNDMACGSTIGPSLSARCGIKTVDMGAPTLAMHSAREVAAAEDPFMLHKVVHRYFSFKDEPLLSLT